MNTGLYCFSRSLLVLSGGFGTRSVKPYFQIAMPALLAICSLLASWAVYLCRKFFLDVAA
jgi:hypothetical protein